MPPTCLPPLTIWAYSFCRSTLATYLSLAAIYPGNVEIVVCGKVDPENRARSGFRSQEFSDADFAAINPSIDEAVALLKARSQRIHMFTGYHGSAVFEALLKEATATHMAYFIAAEAPHNMERTYLRSIAKKIYIPTVLRRRVARFIKQSLFFVCYSGNSSKRLKEIGWPEERVEEFGYYPPSLQSARPNLTLPKRSNAQHGGPIHFLATSTHCRHKSPKTLIDAVEILVNKGYGDQFRCTVAGSGLQTDAMTDQVAKLGLPVTFPGFVSLEELITLYRTADIFVGTGVEEPWGIRINDAIQLGCPSIVSSGMGAWVAVEKFHLGWVYRAGSASDLAGLMCRLIENRSEIQSVNQRLQEDYSLAPHIQARQLLNIIKRRLLS